MKPKLLVRIAAGCLLFFAAGHSIGHFTRHNVEDPKEQEVLKAMAGNKFERFGALRSFDENYTGMSLNLILTLLVLAALLWVASDIAEDNARRARALLIPIALCVAGFAVTGFMYFFLVPAITCCIAASLIGIAVMYYSNER